MNQKVKRNRAHPLHTPNCPRTSPTIIYIVVFSIVDCFSKKPVTTETEIESLTYLLHANLQSHPSDLHCIDLIKILHYAVLIEAVCTTNCSDALSIRYFLLFSLTFPVDRIRLSFNIQFTEEYTTSSF